MHEFQLPSAQSGTPWSWRRLRTRTLILLIAGALSACGGNTDDSAPASSNDPVPEVKPPKPEQPEPKPLELTILHINDHHSNLDSQRKTLKLRDASQNRVAVSVEAGGFARVTAAFKELTAASGNVIKLHAGDALTGTLYFSRAGKIGEPDAAMMNTVCFDAFTLGNHEFDKGDTELRQWLELLQSQQCKTPVLSANVRFGANSALNPSRAPDMVKPYTVIEREGQQIGVIGLTIGGKTKASSSPDADTTFENEVTAAQGAIDTLKGQGINKIVLLSHLGYDYEKQVLAQLSGVDVLIGGDSHTLLGPDSLNDYGVGSPSGAYGQALKNKDGETVCIAQAWEYSQIVGELNVSFDPEGRVTACEGTPHVLIGKDFKIGAELAQGADLSAILADVAASGFLRISAPDAAAELMLKPYQERIDVYKQTEVANAPLILCSRRVPGGPGSVDYGRSGTACNAEGSVSIRGGDIQQLVAQAYLMVADKQYGGADFSLQSGGGVRIPLDGRVTAAKVIEVLPFDNKLWKLRITGAETKSMIEDGLEAVFGPKGSTGPYPYAGGLRWDVDARQPKGSRASNIEALDRQSNTWLPLDDSRLYDLFVLSFNATGGDGYTTLANVPSERRFDVGVQDADVFQSYIDTLAADNTGLPVIHRLDHSLYSTKSFIGPTAP